MLDEIRTLFGDFMLKGTFFCPQTVLYWVQILTELLILFNNALCIKSTLKFLNFWTPTHFL